MTQYPHPLPGRPGTNTAFEQLFENDLSERQRVVIVLRYFVDLPDDQIADILDCRPTTIRSLARRAFRILRKELS